MPDELQLAYARTFERLRRMFRARGCPAEEAADLAQEAAVRAFVHVRRWGANGEGLDPLLNRIARNLLIDRYRRATPHIVPLDDMGDLQDPAQDPTEEVARRQRTAAVRSAILRLPVRHQAAITYSLSGLSPEEVGRRMGIGRNAADALLHRARRSLKETLRTAGEGMFGIALGIRVRWDRLTRRGGAGVEILESARAATLQSGLGVATVALVAAISVVSVGPGGEASLPPSDSTIPGATPVKSAVVAAEPAADPAAPAPARTTTLRLGPVRHTAGEGRSTTHVGVPSPGGERRREILGIDVEMWDEQADTPLDRRYRSLSDRVCSAAPGLCWPSAGGGER